MPTVWNFFKELWNRPKSVNTAEKKPIKRRDKFLWNKTNRSSNKNATYIPPNTQETAPNETQTTKIKSDPVTRTNKIPKPIKGIENIEVTSNSTNGTSKPKYKFKSQYFCKIINVTTETTNPNTSSRIPHLTTKNNIEATTNKVLETSKCTSKKYETTTFWESNTQNEETTAKTEYTAITQVEKTFPTSNPTTTDPQPIVRHLNVRNYYRNYP